MPLAYVKGEFVPEAEATLPISERAVRFGDGVFETLRIEAGVPYQWERHQERLVQGLTALAIPLPLLTRLKADARLLVARNGVAEGLLRIQVSRGGKSTGYLPEAGSPPPTVIMETLPLPHVPELPVALWHSTWRKPAPAALPVESKTLQGLNATLARMEAREHGCFEALLTTEAGEICETSSANIFWVAEGRLHTPPARGILAGTIRAAVLRLSPLPVEESPCKLEALEHAEEVFLTNVSWLALPVGALEPQDWHWRSSTVAEQLTRLLRADMEAYAAAAHA